MSRKIVIGIAGAGFIAGYHFECIQRVYGANVEVAGILDVVSEKSRDFASSRDIEVFETLDEMLLSVDVVDVCTPPFAHEEVILAAAAAGRDIICEKPLIGHPGNGRDDFRGDVAPKEPMLREVMATLRRIRDAVSSAGVTLCYAENCVYSPSVQKEREIIEKTDAQILRMLGEESHNGNHASYSSFWKYACGGSIISTGSHPLGVLLYLKRVEGQTRDGKPIRPASVSARMHGLTRIPSYRDKGFIRTGYHDVEDYGWIHVVFEDGTVGDVVTGSTVLGGIYDYIEVFANNHRTRCRINPVNLLDTYNPGDEGFDAVYLVEKASTQLGWSNAAPDELWTVGYQAEMQDFITSISERAAPQSSLDLATDTAAVIYHAYLSAERGGMETKIEVEGN